jgi:phosphoglycolate phosphatase-like HAD superfamily hydrolase
VPLLRAKGLHGFFDKVFGGDAFARKKPDPLPLVKTCEALGTPCTRTLMIGDSSNDALAARAAGCPVLLVTYGYNHGEPIRAVDADGFLDSIGEAVAWIDSSTAERAPRQGLCYTLSMFIHRTSITGLSDRGAWPWRTPRTVTA